ncbi:flagellar protein FliT [Bacillus sp. NEB1478]|uniref:flagellar protein FliT n=1 Tax=Bacillus sp. NEB1478 TaxID=3073816 RepID=UPI00287397A9|nr:flagellar protein FliT [Bacillus sp. NEB1478]WNB92739.1 flagellar protein FliT [Bacillus sp. NEB1478]
MSAVKILLEITKNLHDHVNAGLPKEEREPYIERLNELLEQRQAIMDKLPLSYTDEEKRMGKMIVKLNETIEPLLALKLDQIKQNLTLMKKKKINNVQYANPYQSVSSDGMFFDKKK